VGGYGAALEIHDLCRARGVPLWCGGMLESGVGRAHNVALATLPGFTLPGDLSPSARYWVRDLASPEWTMTEGALMPLPAPGIGVEPDRARLEAVAIRRHQAG
jgi:o-succinylbenzoate synthase